MRQKSSCRITIGVILPLKESCHFPKENFKMTAKAIWRKSFVGPIWEIPESLLLHQAPLREILWGVGSRTSA